MFCVLQQFALFHVFLKEYGWDRMLRFIWQELRV